MLLKKTLLAATIAVAFASGSVMADAWTVTQSAVLGDDTSIKQFDGNGLGAVTDALQGINVINTKTGASTIDGSQSITVSSGKTVTFAQEDMSGSIQAGNYVTTDSTGTITTSGGTAFKQSADGATYTLVQGSNAGGGNKQAINFMESEGTVNGIEQTIATSGTSLAALDMDQRSISTDSEIQAGNLIDAKAPTGAKQELYVTALTMDQDGTKSKALQAGNAILTASADTGATVTQTLSTGAGSHLHQSSVTGSTQAGNYLGITP